MLCYSSPGIPAKNQPKEVIVLCQKVPVYLSCSKLVGKEGKACGCPLVKKGEEGNDGMVRMVCSNGHITPLDAMFVSLHFSPPKLPNPPSLSPPASPKIAPDECPVCHTPVDRNLAVSGNTVTCGCCQATLSWNFKRKEWEQRYVGDEGKR